MIGIALHYIKDKMKFNSITYLIKFEDKKNRGLSLKTWFKSISKKLDLIDSLGK